MWWSEVLENGKEGLYTSNCPYKSLWMKIWNTVFHVNLNYAGPFWNRGTSPPLSVSEITDFTQIQCCTQLMNYSRQKPIMVTSKKENTVPEKQPNQPDKKTPIKYLLNF